ncbi:MAG: hypothetical protein ACRDHK_16000 [Actinomycetota bacterium]
MRATRIVLLVAAVTLSAPAGADTVLLGNGDSLTGELQVTELTVLIPTGGLRIGRGEISQVVFGTATGDTVEFRSGRSVGGTVDQPSYAIRLPSGQTVVLERERILVVRFSK